MDNAQVTGLGELGQYIQHKHNCTLGMRMGKECECGLTDTLARHRLERSEPVGCQYPVHGSVTHVRNVECCDFCGHPADTTPPEPVGWMGIESAPVNTPVRIKAGNMTFLARLIPDASMSDLDTACDQWQAEIEGEHPPCWSGGACWASNEDGVTSLQPTAWRYPGGTPEPVAEIERLVEQIVRDVAELPDRSSPIDWPEAMYVTADELAEIVRAALGGAS